MDMFTLHRGRDTGLRHHTQVGMLTCVHARVRPRKKNSCVQVSSLKKNRVGR